MNSTVSSAGTAWCVQQIALGDAICMVKPQELGCLSCRLKQISFERFFQCFLDSFAVGQCELVFWR